MSAGKLFWIPLLLVFALLPVASASAATSEPGSSIDNPITFDHLAPWLADSRASMDLFEETLRTDMLAFRFNMQASMKTNYFLFQDGRVFSGNAVHYTFQSMFWGPLFSALIWTIPALGADIAMALGGGSSDASMTQMVWALFLAANEANKESIFPKILHVNVLFTSDVLALYVNGSRAGTNKELFDTSGPNNNGALFLGNTYAGLCFKVLEKNVFFAGFNFVQVPLLANWQNHLTPENGYSADSIVTRSADNLRVKLYLYNNFLDIAALKGLINLDNAAKAFDYLGLGFFPTKIFPIVEKVIKLESFLSYLADLDKYSLDLKGDILLPGGLALPYRWNFSLKPFSVFDYGRIGLKYFAVFDDDSSVGQTYFQFRLDALTFNTTNATGTEQKYGFYSDVTFGFPLSFKLVAGLSYNADDTMGSLPFSRDDLVVFGRIEIGMDNNFDSRLEPVYRDANGR